MHETAILGRGRGLVIGTPEHFRWLYSIAKWVLLLNLLDGVFTLIWVEHFGATEKNIMMSDLVHSSALMFMLVKLTLVSLGVLFLWRNRSNPLAVICLFVSFFTYYLVLLFHIQYSARVFL
ncbi:MAG: DUF5658 family protein [Gemmatimonadota bacterium]|jgi:hypothetical protein